MLAQNDSNVNRTPATIPRHIQKDKVIYALYGESVPNSSAFLGLHSQQEACTPGARQSTNYRRCLRDKSAIPARTPSARRHAHLKYSYGGFSFGGLSLAIGPSKA
ncbi:hypothetical protein NOR_07838 [Metarhizium rileyi]|uniref:Uncharacterized protein n=1 Tax=Metarhizium rileyi (strain RCEF 4871) TaxID=1649241 RepID=A0A166XC09_METRR|nr:hypothetical protein NOR_07838 [Metarhizium rileyi RCEF 4871]TWU78780.1 hypothetical protein ED733_006935 [Metarhizium rileyi]